MEYNGGKNVKSGPLRLPGRIYLPSGKQPQEGEEIAEEAKPGGDIPANSAREGLQGHGQKLFTNKSLAKKSILEITERSPEIQDHKG